MNRPIVSWDANTQPLFDKTPTTFPLAADLAESQAQLLAAQVSARVKAEHDLATLHAVACGILECSVDQERELEALKKRQALMVAAAKELIADLTGGYLEGKTLKLVCNFNRAVTGT